MYMGYLICKSCKLAMYAVIIYFFLTKRDFYKALHWFEKQPVLLLLGILENPRYRKVGEKSTWWNLHIQTLEKVEGVELIDIQQRKKSIET